MHIRQCRTSSLANGIDANTVVIKPVFKSIYGVILATGLGLAAFSLSGCGGQPADEQDETTTQTSQTGEDASNSDADSDGENADKISTRSLISERSFNDSGGSRTPRRTSLGGAQAIERIGLALKESLELGPATVVWIFDGSTNAESFNSPLRDEVVRLYESFENESFPNELTTDVAVYGAEIEFLLDRPTDQVDAVSESLQSITFDRGDVQNTFAAIEESIRRQEAGSGERQMFFVCLTNEAGSDRDQMPSTSETLRESRIPLFVVGLPAPFGRIGNESSRNMMRQNNDAQNGLVIGPESCRSERIQLAFPTSAEQTFWIDSGFGAWGLERLARLNGGRYLIVRDSDVGFSGGLTEGEWPRRSARRFSDEVMSRYKPSYSSEAEYLAEVESSAMRKALIDAARLPLAQVLTSTTLEFDARDTARLVNQVTQSQREPARVLPRIEALKDTLQAGESARAQEQDPRWQAAYDLAMGRALAAYARADGYNTLLADLKQGRSFSEPGSDSWILEPTKTFEEGGTSIRSTSEKAVEYLERVIAEHPGTPWAYLAEQELSQSIGWKVVESDRYEDD